MCKKTVDEDDLSLSKLTVCPKTGLLFSEYAEVCTCPVKVCTSGCVCSASGGSLLCDFGRSTRGGPIGCHYAGLVTRLVHQIS